MNYEFKGTQQEWVYDDRFIHAYEGDNQIKICDVYSPIHDIGYHSPSISRANARLIAAAPELLKACIDILNYEERFRAKGNPTIANKWLNQVKASVHKALNIK